MVEGARLESVYTETYRGFESLSLRQFKNPASAGFLICWGKWLDESPVRQIALAIWTAKGAPQGLKRGRSPRFEPIPLSARLKP